MFRPTLLLTFGETAHVLFASLIDKPHAVPLAMKEAFAGTFYPVSISGVAFEYSPCLHIQTFRVAETYGDKVKAFKATTASYLAAHDGE